VGHFFKRNTIEKIMRINTENVAMPVLNILLQNRDKFNYQDV